MSSRDYLVDVHRLLVLLFRQVEETHGREEALRLARRAGEAMGREMAIGQLRGRSIDDFEGFRSFWKELMASPLFSATQEVRIVSEGEGHLCMRVDRCLWAEHFKDLGDVELGHLVCCNADHCMIATYNPKLRLRRSRTIMQGHDHCDHCFQWED